MSKPFKIIAIRPLYKCDQDFRKSLKPGQVYQFYDNYRIDYVIKSDSVNGISKAYHVSEEIFNLDNGISVNVSALVGKNGSGKSTLFDLLYLFIYILSSDTSINSESVIKKYLVDIDELIEDAVRDYKLIKSWDENPSPEKVIELSDIAKRYDFDIEFRTVRIFNEFLEQVKSKLNNKIKYLYAEHRDELNAEEKIASGLKMSLIYEVNGIIYELTHNHRKFNYAQLNEDSRQELDFKKEFLLQDFFYNVCLNYSHHSLNSKISGKWIMKLFHKNDGYITPVVINPMRNEGNFDINKEINLSKERLMINIIHELVRNKKFLLLNKYEVTSIILSPKKPAPFLSDEGNNKYDDLVSGFLLKSIIAEKDLESLGYYKDNALGYLEKKIPKIKRNYRQIIFKGLKESDKIFKEFVSKDKNAYLKKSTSNPSVFKDD
ncbi:predicted ATP-binding protein [Nonlabens ulvanivorans]|uniref:Predicted ATP-binding protein n=1 Tax=Nonlabens ulvanivorans TaxID=906888 RepID=A0A090WCF2_NONUL|nr:AAA family ATPase [Nonlabens ulvanivorans]GAL74636.1 predicted ATP-binding protein [Nonlabens ulvanivorans]